MLTNKVAENANLTSMHATSNSRMLVLQFYMQRNSSNEME